MTARKLVLVA